MPLQLSERQQTTVAAGLTILAVFVILLALAALFYLVGAFFARFSNVFLPLATAAVAALVFKPYFELLRNRLRLPPVVALTAVFLSIAIPLAAFVFFFGHLLVEQIGDLISKAPEWWVTVKDQILERWPQVQQHPYYQRVSEAIQGQGGAVMEGLQFFGNTALSAGAGVLRWTGTLFAWAVLPVYFSFFLLAESKPLPVESLLPFLKSETRQDVGYLVREFISIIVAFFRGQLVIAFLQGLLFATGFTVVGLKYGFVLGLLLGFLNIIPYLGNIIGLAIAIPLALFQADGGLVRLGLTLAVFALVQMIEGYILTPRIMGDRTGLHPMVIIVAIFFWGSALGGITGMILAIPLTAFLVVFWRLAREKYMRELV